MASAPTANELQCWTVVIANLDSNASSGQIEVEIDGFADALAQDDVAFLRYRKPEGSDEIVGWGTCSQPTDDGGGTRRLLISRRAPGWASPLPVEGSDQLWSIACRRTPHHRLHGLSAREARLLWDATSSLGSPTPPAPPSTGRGSIDEILLVAAELALLRPDPDPTSSGAKAASRVTTGGHGRETGPSVVRSMDLAMAAAVLGRLLPQRYPIAASFGARLISRPSAANEGGLDELTEQLGNALGIDRTDTNPGWRWKGSRSDQLPPVDEDAANLIALVDELARRLPIGPAATDAHLAVGLIIADGPNLLADDRELADEIVAEVVNEFDPDRASGWWVAVGLPPRSTFVPAIAPDSSEGTDRLDRMGDISAFAAAIASRSLQPPLSIGIFGEWGSGKSFFMRKLRSEIDRLNRSVSELPRHERIAFCERIAQVEFNAWHYAETEHLWPSLIHHLLAHLAVGTGDEADLLTDRLLATLEETDAKVLEKAQAVEAAQRAVEEAAERADSAREELSTAEQTVPDLDAVDIWELVGSDTQLREQVDAVRQHLGGSPVGDSALDLYEAAGDTIEIVRSGWSILRLDGSDAKVDTHRKRTALIAVLLLVAGLVGALLVEKMADSTVVAAAIASLGPFASILAGVTNWLRVQNERANQVVKRMAAIRQQLNERHEEALSGQRQLVAQAENDVKAKREQEIEAERQLETARAERAKAQDELDAVSSDRRLADFVQSRSETYGGLVGLVTNVRNDFERLGRLLAAVRHDSDLVRGIAELPDGTELPEPPLDEGAERLAIDRIVVYIDDLDRCRPETVVKVLEAVHLLLAFDFIVVVVGVDARWVGRSLIQAYPTLLSASELAPEVGPLLNDLDPPVRTPEEPRANSKESVQGRPPRREILQRPASEHDYIEKIFQVPYWLEPLDAEKTGNLVRDLVGQVRMLGVAETETLAAPHDARPVGDDLASYEVSKDAEATISALDSRLDAAVGFNPNPAGLALTDRELKFMEIIYPLVGRSPRSAKRFVNVYRIIKAGLDEEELDTWVGPEQAAYPCHAALLLLAIVCGAPESSTRVLAELDGIEPGEPWQSVCTAIDGAIDAVGDDERERWDETKKRYDSSAWPPVGADLIKAWLARIAQYSFRSGHLDLVRPLASAIRPTRSERLRG